MCEFCVIHGLCGRTARNLHDPLEFLKVLCRGRCLKIRVEYFNKMCEFRVIRGLCGRTARNLRDPLEFDRGNLENFCL